MQIRILVMFFAASFLISSCATQQKVIVAEYGDYSIPLQEFENAYEKSIGGLENAVDDSIQSYKDFLDLYVNFKMKLRDAKVRGYYDNPDLQSEYEQYRDNLGETYLMERKVINPGIKKLYDLRKNEVRASHILLSTSDEDEEAVYEKAKNVIDEINSGADFDSLAIVYSADNYTKNNGGDVYYLVAGSILPDLEEAIYSLDVGEVYSEPVKTKFGYHIIKLTERRPYKPSITARHILASVRDSNNNVDFIKSMEKIKDLKQRLDSGENFAMLASKYSDDKGSAIKYGNLGAFKRRMMVRPFDEAAFNLKEGETSGIVKTNFGYHIIQVTSVEEYPTFEEDRENLLKLYKQNRYADDRSDYFELLKDQLNYTLNEISIEELVSDSVKFDDEYINSNLSKTSGTTPVFEIGNNIYNIDSIVEFAKDNNQFHGESINQETFANAVDKYSEHELVNSKMLLLEKEDPEFAELMDEYKNGLYIFKIQEEEVWKKLELDSAEVLNYYNDNKENYVWPDRVNYSEIFLKDSLKAFSLSKVLNSGGNFDTIAGNENDKPGLKEKNGFVGIAEADKNELTKTVFSLENEGDVSDPIKSQGGWSILKLNKKLPSRIKKFEECRQEVMSAYQEYESRRLEQKYLEKLNNLYQPVKKYDVLKNAFNSKKNIKN